MGSRWTRCPCHCCACDPSWWTNTAVYSAELRWGGKLLEAIVVVVVSFVYLYLSLVVWEALWEIHECVRLGVLARGCRLFLSKDFCVILSAGLRVQQRIFAWAVRSHHSLLICCRFLQSRQEDRSTLYNYSNCTLLNTRSPQFSYTRECNRNLDAYSKRFVFWENSSIPLYEHNMHMMKIKSTLLLFSGTSYARDFFWVSMI